MVAKSTTGRQSGFTLLEVLVSTTIVGLVFGGVFSAIVASKQLDFKVKKSFQRSAEHRLLGNLAELYLSIGKELPPDLLPASYQMEFEPITIQFGDEENILQGGQLESFSISSDSAGSVSGIVWAPPSAKR